MPCAVWDTGLMETWSLTPGLTEVSGGCTNTPYKSKVTAATYVTLSQPWRDFKAREKELLFLPPPESP